LISNPPQCRGAMVSTLSKALAVVVAAGFFLIIIEPIASLGTWLAGVALAFILVPILVILAMSWSKSKAEHEGKGLLEEEIGRAHV
jgi:hypothetical protein